MRSADEERSERLRSVDLTSGLDRVALARLAAYMDPIAVRAGDVVITEGDTGDALYIIVRGTFAVLAGPGAERLNTIGPGHYVGELALLVDEPRSATIRADTDGEVLRLDRQQFVDLLGRDAGAARAVATTLARRLRRRDGALPDEAAATVAAIPSAPKVERHRVTKAIGVIIAAACIGVAFSALVDVAQWRFGFLLLAAVALWVTEPVPNVVVSLGLIGAVVISGLAPSYATVQGFATMNWVFVLSVLGIAAAVARSGLLLRLGLLLIERVPPRLGWQSAAFLVTGMVL